MTVLDAFDRAVCDDAELAERLDRPHAAVTVAVEAHASRVARSLDSTAADDEREPATIGDVIGLDDAEYERAEARTTVERLTSILDPRARDVLRMRLQHDLRAVGDRSGDRLLADAGLPDHHDVARRLSAHASRAWRMVDERRN